MIDITISIHYYHFYSRKDTSFLWVVGKSLVLILIRLIVLAIAVVTGFGVIILMSMGVENNAYAQWILPWQLKDGYKQQHIEDNNQTKILTAAATTIHQFVKPVPEK
jgi:hypothetical protein